MVAKQPTMIRGSGYAPKQLKGAQIILPLQRDVGTMWGNSWCRTYDTAEHGSKGDLMY